MPQPKAQSIRGLVVSDLHLFARRSDGLRRMESLQAQLRETDLLVLNGDIFDFRWSTLSEHAHSIREAVLWLREFADSNSNCQIHYVLGNHDCLIDFIPELDRVKHDRQNFEWHEYSLQLGDRLFLHGDCVHWKMDEAGLKRYRESWSQDDQRHGPVTPFYQLADRLGMTRLVHKIHFPRARTLHRLVHHLNDARPQWQRSVQHCYFGHTHEPFTDVAHDDVTFHNTGSAIRGMRFNPISFNLNGTNGHE